MATTSWSTPSGCRRSGTTRCGFLAAASGGTSPIAAGRPAAGAEAGRGGRPRRLQRPPGGGEGAGGGGAGGAALGGARAAGAARGGAAGGRGGGRAPTEAGAGAGPGSRGGRYAPAA